MGTYGGVPLDEATGRPRATADLPWGRVSPSSSHLLGGWVGPRTGPNFFGEECCVPARYRSTIPGTSMT